MIPKIIHYVWLGEKPIPKNQIECMDSWKKYCPDAEIVRWDASRFDVNSVPLVVEALKAGKYAFAADCIRIYALYSMGGVYLDTDVMLYDNIFNLFDADFISAVEYHPKKNDLDMNIGVLDNEYKRISNRIKVFGIGILSAVLASVPNHPYMKKCLDFYYNISLSELFDNHFTAPTVLAYNAEEFGFRYVDMEQRLYSGIHLYTTSILSLFDQYNSKSVAVHYCAGSWVKKGFFRKCLDFIKSNKLTFAIYTFLKRKKMI